MDLEAVQDAVGAVQDPELHRGLGELGMVRTVEADGDRGVSVLIALTIPGCPLQDRLSTDVTDAARSVDGVDEVTVEFTSMNDTERSTVIQTVQGESNIREVTIGKPGSKTRVIGVSSGKGGVGKSTVTTNLAVALAGHGKKVGLIDADVWGFSIPKMLGIDRQPVVLDDVILPPEAHGVAVMSMDYFVGDDQPVIWRGPMLHKAIEQFLVDVFWDDPDFLLIDMPPGTGDVAISLSQFLPRAEAIVVTTPQPTAERVAARAGLMAEKVNQHVLGVVENMSWFTGDDGTRYPIFGEGGGQTVADKLGVDLLGQIPLVPAMREGADAGKPVAEVDPEGEAAAAFDRLAAELIDRGPRLRTHPELVITD